MPNHPQISPAPPADAVGRFVNAAGQVNPRHLRLTTLRWAVGGFCATIGALMLVVPHQFSSPTFNAIRPILPWYGLVTLTAGVGLLLAALLRPRRALLTLAQGACGIVLLFFAFMLFRGGSYSGGPLYLSLGLGTLATGLLAPEERRRAETRPGGDIFAVVMGFCAFCVGTVMLAVPGQFLSPIYDAIRPLLWLFGAVYLIVGAALMLAEAAGGTANSTVGF